MKKQYAGLIALNLGLLLVLALVCLTPGAGAQEAVPRPRGDYTMVGGRIDGATESAIWIVDTANQEFLVLRWNNGQHTLQGIGYRNFANDLRQLGGQAR